ncbi:hypothetical protein E3P99_03952 [Wallemia hederae]|uniref:Uncharacterized protein n=1 Tax=Wallemia hederae TaxID=1540922 RepID=A0A4T0FCC9_9BASI|nr:hypothetical protein E3P99_03952 [Wallemia hederae]
MQIATLVIGPTFLSAIIYVDLGVVGLQYSPSSSLLSPKAFGVVFISGGLASSASNNFDPDLLMTGSNIMLAGIAVQFACIIFYSLFFIEFCVRYYRNLPVKSQREQPIAVDPESPKNQKKLTLRLTMLGIMSFLIIWRGIYRLIELSDGWSGQVIRKPRCFRQWSLRLRLCSTGDKYCRKYLFSSGTCHLPPV